MQEVCCQCPRTCTRGYTAVNYHGDGRVVDFVHVVDLCCNSDLYDRSVHRLVLLVPSEATELQLLPG